MIFSAGRHHGKASSRRRVYQRGREKYNRAIVCLLRLIGVNGVRDENAGAEKAHQYCCKLNHDTRPYAQPALITDNTDRR
jgi:hypothetical protein